jgi:hypothetical protein
MKKPASAGFFMRVEGGAVSWLRIVTAARAVQSRQGAPSRSRRSRS